MLTSFGPDIWTASGPDVVAYVGFHYPTQMAVIRLSSGDLFIWSPVALSNELRASVDTLGSVAHIVAPNNLHHLSVPEWKSTYPQAKIYSAPGLRDKRKDIAFDGDLSDTPPAAWAGEIDQVVIPNAIASEVVFFHAKSGTVLFTDLLQQFPKGWFKGWRGLVAKLDLMTEAEPAVPRKFRIAFTDKTLARAAVTKVLGWPASKVLMAHGAPVLNDGQAFLERAFRWLKV